MFDSLSERLEGVFKNLRGQGKITEANVKDAMRDVKMALLEADVNYKVVKDFLGRVQEKAAGEEVLLSVTPGQQMVKVIYDELVEILGGQNPPFALHAGKTNVILMLGLQGSGKTTFCGKMAKRFAKEGWKPLLVACDIYRPAAVHQLHVVGEQVGAEVFSQGTDKPAAQIARAGLDHARAAGRDLVIVDTAGRLHINDVLMDELVAIKAAVTPSFTFLVADAMTGQDAVVSAATFNERVGIDGVCLTKMDGDARGGAALSIRTITGKPVKFIGTGEKLGDLEEFFPERMASRILGMGDIVSLVEKAQEHFDEKQAADLQKKMRTASFTLQDFLDQMQQVKRMGPLKGLLEMIPGVGSALKDVDLPEKEMKRTEAIIQSMTPAERGEPSLLNGSRKERIARGSGTTPAEINALVAQFEKARQMMKGMMQVQERMKSAGMGPDGEGMQGSITGAGLSARERARRLQRKQFEKRQRQQQAKRQRQKSHFSGRRMFAPPVVVTTLWGALPSHLSAMRYWITSGDSLSASPLILTLSASALAFTMVISASLLALSNSNFLARASCSRITFCSMASSSCLLSCMLVMVMSLMITSPARAFCTWPTTSFFSLSRFMASSSAR